MAGHPRFRKVLEDQIALHEAKNHDYAAGGDPLGNFNRVASILKLYADDRGSLPITPEIVAIIYSLKQVDAVLWQLVKSMGARVEGMTERVPDVAVYWNILQCMLLDKVEGLTH